MPGGGLPRPDVAVDAKDLRDHAFGLVRVLNHNHCAIGDWAPELSHDELLIGLRTMVLTRAYDERMLKMQRTKRLSFYMKSLGEEAVSIAAAHALRDDDMLFPSYRQQGALIYRGADLVDMMCRARIRVTTYSGVSFQFTTLERTLTGSLSPAIWQRSFHRLSAGPWPIA